MAIQGILIQPGFPFLPPTYHPSCHPFGCFHLLFPPHNLYIQEWKREQKQTFPQYSVFMAPFAIATKTWCVKQSFIMLTDSMG